MKESGKITIMKNKIRFLLTNNNNKNERIRKITE